jgi:adenylate kinase
MGITYRRSKYIRGQVPTSRLEDVSQKEEEAAAAAAAAAAAGRSSIDIELLKIVQCSAV